MTVASAAREKATAIACGGTSAVLVRVLGQGSTVHSLAAHSLTLPFIYSILTFPKKKQ